MSKSFQKEEVNLMKMNCWELKKCERQQGGKKTGEMGICPAAINANHHGKNDGENAGRYCWKVAGTLCGGRAEGTFAAIIRNCTLCDFYVQVRQEEGSEFVL
jgi:hypothetical protein